jgi:hypothetical protein
VSNSPRASSSRSLLSLYDPITPMTASANAGDENAIAIKMGKEAD